MDGVMNERTTKVSNIKPRPIVVPTCPMIRKSLTAPTFIKLVRTGVADCGERFGEIVG